MKSFYILIFYISFFLLSCNDIIDSDKNIMTIIDAGSQGIEDFMEFRFSNDLLSYKNNETTVLWNVANGVIWGKPFHIVNNSKDSVFEVKSVSMKEGTFFYINTDYQFPIKISPGQTNKNNIVTVFINTIGLNAGKYTDKIIINNNENVGFFIQVNVY